MADTLTAHYSWTKPDPGASPNTWGNKLNSDLDNIDSQVWSLNTQATTNAFTIMRGADAGPYGALNFNSNAASVSASTQRWQLYETSETESGGGNAGTNFGLAAYDNTGALLGQAFTIARATQASTFYGAMTVNGVLTAAGTVNVGSLNVSGPLNAAGVGVFNSLNVTHAATISGTLGVAGAASIGGTLGVTGTATFNAANFNGFITGGGGNFSGTFSISSAAITSGEISNLTVDQNAYFASASAGTAFAIYQSSGVRLVQFSPQWSWNWNTSGGLLSWNTPTGAVFQLDGSGNLYLNGGLTQHSDAAAKESITVFDADPLSIIKAIAPKWFKWVASPERWELGFIAQDVQATLPEAVHESKDGKLGIDQTPLVAVLWRTVQTLAARVESLEARLR